MWNFPHWLDRRRERFWFQRHSSRTKGRFSKRRRNEIKQAERTSDISTMGNWNGRSAATLASNRNVTELVLFTVARKAREPSGQLVQFACNPLEEKIISFRSQWKTNLLSGEEHSSIDRKDFYFGIERKQNAVKRSISHQPTPNGAWSKMISQSWG